MTRLIHGAPNFRNAAGGSRGRLVVDYEYGLDAVFPVRPEPRFQFRGRGAPAPIARTVVDLDAKFFGNLAPELRKVSGLKQQDSITWGQGVHDCGFPSSRSR